MPISKLYWKLCLKRWKIIVIYFMIGIVQLGLAFMNYQERNQIQFQMKSSVIAIVDEDQTSYSQAFLTYLKKYHQVIYMQSMQEVEDALYYRQVVLGIHIPKDFIQAVDTVTTSYSTSNIQSIYVKQFVIEYLNMLQMYRQAYPKDSIEQISKKMDTVLSKQTTINFLNDASKQVDLQEIATMMIFYSYTIFATLFTCIDFTMSILQKKSSFQRILCSSLSIKDFILQSFLGTGGIICFTYMIYMITIMIMFPSYIFTKDGLTMIGLSFMFSISLGSIIFFISCFMALKKEKSKELNAIAEVVIPLVVSFISGVFVPQTYLHETLLKIASFTPVYWFVQGIESIVYETFSSMQFLTCGVIFILFMIVSLLGAILSLRHYVKYRMTL